MQKPKPKLKFGAVRDVHSYEESSECFNFVMRYPNTFLKITRCTPTPIYVVTYLLNVCTQNRKYIPTRA